MKRETAPITAVTIINYDAPTDIPAYQERMRQEASEGSLDSVLLREAIDHLGYCRDTPDTKIFMTLRRWQHSPETAPRDELGEVRHSLISDPIREMTVDPDNLPSDTSRLLGRLYELTGASVIRDDTNDEGTTEGVVIRRGTYKGSKVYFRETYGDLPEDSIYFSPDLPLQRSLGIEVMGQDRGIIALEEISPMQLLRLEAFVGEGYARQFTDPHRFGEADRVPFVNHSNFAEILDLVARASIHSMPSDEEWRRTHSSSHRLRRLLGSLGIRQAARSELSR